MRKKYKEQLPLMGHTTDHPHTVEIDIIDKILGKTSTIYDLALQDLTRKVRNKETGATGMSAEQVVNAAILKQSQEFSYEDLAFHIVDSGCYRKFMKIGFADKGFSPSALCANIKALTAETWEAINRVIVAYANETKAERGRTVRIDCTVVPSNIHTNPHARARAQRRMKIMTLR
jgi:IS5 family transposase